MFLVNIITVSDRCYRGEQADGSGPALRARMEQEGYRVGALTLVPDEKEEIKKALRAAAAGANLVLTTGGTGFAPRDVTPEATMEVLERLAPGIPEAMRSASLRITPRGMLSRGVAGILGNTLIINLPGSPKAAIENLEAVLPALGHGLTVLQGATMNCAELER